MRLTASIFLLLYGMALNAQVYATTDDGQRVVLKENRTWAFLEKSDGEKVFERCGELTKTEYDEMTGRRSKVFKKTVGFGGETSAIGIQVLEQEEGRIYFLATVVEDNSLACMEEGSELILLFTNGKKLSLKSESRFNCDGVFSATLERGRAGSEGPFESLSRYMIKKARVYTSAGVVEHSLPDEKAEIFRDAANCIYFE